MNRKILTTTLAMTGIPLTLNASSVMSNDISWTTSIKASIAFLYYENLFNLSISIVILLVFVLLLIVTLLIKCCFYYDLKNRHQKLLKEERKRRW